MRIQPLDQLQSTALPYDIDRPARPPDQYIDKYSEGPQEQVPHFFAFSKKMFPLMCVCLVCGQISSLVMTNM